VDEVENLEFTSDGDAQKSTWTWEGFTREHDSWEPEENLENAQDKVNEYYESRRK
jgi:hypothetical protein